MQLARPWPAVEFFKRLPNSTCSSWETTEVIQYTDSTPRRTPNDVPVRRSAVDGCITKSITPERQPATSQRARQTRGRSNSATTACFPSSIAVGGHKPIYLVDRHSGAEKYFLLENVRSKERARGYCCHIRKAWKDKPADVKQAGKIYCFRSSGMRESIFASASWGLAQVRLPTELSVASIRLGRILFKKLNSCAFNEKEILVRVTF